MRRFADSLIFSILILQSYICLLSANPKIAIIGGGIGGASASHYLNELFHGELNMDLFEAKELGGRLATVEVAGTEYESGGSIIHDKNLLMRHFVKLLGMEERPSCGDQKFAIWNKDEFVFEESSWTVMTVGRLIFRYSLQPFRLHSHVNSVLEDFSKIYQLHDQGIAFKNVTALLSALNVEFPKMLQISTQEYLTKAGFSPRLINELVEATLVVNYGQNTNVQSFVGCVSVAGAGADLWSVKGGNKDVPKHLIYRNSKVNVVPSIVKKIVHIPRKNNSPIYEVHYINNGSSDVIKSIYDIVIIAVPLTADHKMAIEFKDFPKNVNLEFPGSYQTTIVTFVHGDLQRKYFNLDDSIDAILSCNPNKTIISSVGNLVSVDGKCSRVWKIFSREPLEQSFINEMFTNIENKNIINWKAYPKYERNNPRLDFKLYESLYHVNAIEWAASAMEMSAIGGRNVAILAYNEYMRSHLPKESLDVPKYEKLQSSEDL
ncbi:prenylcysteine oxidase-like [Venturia canescens]|uniref:prenylcysteine oxidase-like n=1 Tax=Venturia canescens TaxID=32260 RepID=UPI001C9C869A|nr:prenylcysteine oxidase-like [Venturia canescens]